jgi:hypothetical protein
MIESILSALTLAILVRQLPVPIGESAATSYEIGGLIGAISILLGRLFSTLTPTPLLSSLRDLRNDIIFLRIDIDEALRRYETLTEGETLPDALKEDLAAVIADLDFLSYAHSNMATLLGKMKAALADSNITPEVAEQSIQSLKLDADSFVLHERNCNEVLEGLKKKLGKLDRKQARYAGVSEDWAAVSNLRTSLTQRLQTMRLTHEGLLRDFRALRQAPTQTPPQ